MMKKRKWNIEWSSVWGSKQGGINTPWFCFYIKVFYICVCIIPKNESEKTDASGKYRGKSTE